MRQGRSTREEEDNFNYHRAYEEYAQGIDTIPQEVRDMRHGTVCRDEIRRLKRNVIPHEER